MQDQDHDVQSLQTQLASFRIELDQLQQQRAELNEKRAELSIGLKEIGDAIEEGLSMAKVILSVGEEGASMVLGYEIPAATLERLSTIMTHLGYPFDIPVEMAVCNADHSPQDSDPSTENHE